jgi:serine/threonine protein phosphatase PrpC
MAQAARSSAGQSALRVAVATDPGRVRTENQDAVFAAGPAAGLPLGSDWLGLLLVADGAGGYADGGTASQEALKAALAVLTDGSSAAGAYTRRIARAMIAAHAAVHGVAQASGQTAGSTLTVVGVLPHRIVLGHVGDSRAYLLRAGEARQLTEDHTGVAEAVRAGQMRPEEAARSPFRHQLSRALGVGAAITPQALKVAFQPGDTVIVCSDGLWEYVTPEELARLGCAPDSSPAAVCGQLVRLALERGGGDNVSVAVAQYGAPGARRVPPQRGRFWLKAAVVLLLGLGVGMVLSSAFTRRQPTSPAQPKASDSLLPPPHVPMSEGAQDRQPVPPPAASRQRRARRGTSPAKGPVAAKAPEGASAKAVPIDRLPAGSSPVSGAGPVPKGQDLQERISDPVADPRGDESASRPRSSP